MLATVGCSKIEDQKPPFVPNCSLVYRVRGICSRKNWCDLLQSPEMAVLKRIHTGAGKSVDEEKVSAMVLEKSLWPLLVYSPAWLMVSDFAGNLYTYAVRNAWRKVLVNQKPNTISDCVLDSKKLWRYARVLLRAARFESALGEKNCADVAQWICKLFQIQIRTTSVNLPNLKTLDSPIARCFRSKAMRCWVKDDRIRAELPRKIVRNLCAFAVLFVLSSLGMRFAFCVNSVAAFPVSFFDRKNFERLRQEALKDFRVRYNAVKIEQSDAQKLLESSNPLARLRIFYSNGSFRPIYSSPRRKDWGTANSLSELNAALDGYIEVSQYRRLQGTYHGVKQLMGFVKRIRQTNKHQTLHILTADITKCFSALNPNIVVAVLQELVRNKPVIIAYCWAERQMVTKLCRFRRCAAGFSPVEAKQRLKTLCRDCKIGGIGLKTLTPKNVLDMIISHFKKFVVSIGGKEVVQIKYGVPQGFPLSSRLAHLYLSAFERKYWAAELQNSEVFVFRYIDDFILCAKSPATLKKMVQPLFTGENSFGLQARIEKSQATFADEDVANCGKWISWCGWRISATLDDVQHKVKDGDRQKWRRVAFPARIYSEGQLGSCNPSCEIFESTSGAPIGKKGRNWSL